MRTTGAVVISDDSRGTDDFHDRLFCQIDPAGNFNEPGLGYPPDPISLETEPEEPVMFGGPDLLVIGFPEFQRL